MPRGRNIYDEARLQGRLWTPDAIRPLKVAEWNAGDLSSIATVSGAVSAWRDRSNRGYDASQGASGARPAFSMISFLGKPGVALDGADDFMSLAINPTNAAYSCVAVVYLNANSGNRFIASIGGSGNTSFGSSLCSNVSATGRWGVYDGSVYRSANSTLAITTPYILILDGLESGAFWMNGVADGTYAANGSASSSSGSRIGYAAAGSAMVLRYLAWFSTAMDQRLRSALEGWAAWDSGIVTQCLPVSHPFRNRPPLIGD